MYILKQITKHKLVPVFYHDDPQWCVDVMDTCFEHNIRVFEFTNRGSNALKIFSYLHRFKQSYCTDMCLGAGTIFDRQAALNFINAGASFIVSPCFVDEVFQVCRQHDVAYVPGCMTIKEVFEASKVGCKMVKVFPGAVVGVEFVKAVKAVLPNMQLMVTGGVTGSNIQQWFNAGSDAVGTGNFQTVPKGSHEKLIAQISSLQNAMK